MSNISKLAITAACREHSVLVKEGNLFGILGNALKLGGRAARRTGGKVGSKPLNLLPFKKKVRSFPFIPSATRTPSVSGAPQSTGALLGELGSRAGRAGINLGNKAQHFLYQPGQGLLRTAGKAGLLGAGAMGAKDLATLPFGGWANKDEMGGMRQGGLDYQRQAIDPRNVGAAQAAMNTLGSPLKSLASLPFGDPNASPVGYGDPKTTTSDAGVVRQIHEPKAVGPVAARKKRDWEEAKQQYDALRSAKESELETARANLEGGVYPEASKPFGSDLYEGNEAGQRMVEKAMAQAKIQKLQGELSSGQYGGGLFGWRPSAADLQRTISDRRKYLSNLGLGPSYGGSTGSEWGSPSATRRRELQLRELGY